jgi:hypothetical protein
VGFSSDWLQADEQILKPLVKTTAAKYAADKKLTPAHTGGLPVLIATAALAVLAAREPPIERPGQAALPFIGNGTDHE